VVVGVGVDVGVDVGMCVGVDVGVGVSVGGILHPPNQSIIASITCLRSTRFANPSKGQAKKAVL
jgi:hypothetical protein